MHKEFVALTLLFVVAAAGEIIDRIAVTVDKNVITESEILRQIRITSFLNGTKIDFSADNKRATADRLVEQTLIRREMESSGYIKEAPLAKPLYDQVRSDFKTEAEYKRVLTEHQITDEDVRQATEWQATLLEFISVRFRPGVQISEAEIKDYYESEIASKPESGEKISLEDARDKIIDVLTQQRVDNALDRWLGQSRTQTRIRYRQEVLQ